MKCPQCGFPDSKVLQTRETDDAIRRRRECLQCGARFTTFERHEKLEYYVIKNDNRREPFNREKILVGLTRACKKRPVSVHILESITREIEEMFQERGELEIPTQVIGEHITERLRHLDEVAYIRFASVYRKFKDVDQFHELVQELQESSRKA